MRKIGVIFVALLLLPLLAHAQGVEVSYSVHMQGVGWAGYSSNGETAGTTGQSRRIEAIKVRVSSGSIRYATHVQGTGWTDWSEDDAESGTTGQSKRIEAIKVELTGSLAQQYDVRYRVHMAGIGWGGWSSNGEEAGTTGQSRQMEAIEIRLVSKVAGDLVLDGATNYTVVRGDSLSKIAAARYGQRNMLYFPLIRAANTGVVSDPDVIEVGTTLVIPNLQRNLENPGAVAKIREETAATADQYERQGKAGARALRRQANSL